MNAARSSERADCRDQSEFASTAYLQCHAALDRTCASVRSSDSHLRLLFLGAKGEQAPAISWSLGPDRRGSPTKENFAPPSGVLNNPLQRILASLRRLQPNRGLFGVLDSFTWKTGDNSA